jgi:hypothetical protein
VAANTPTATNPWIFVFISFLVAIFEQGSTVHVLYQTGIRNGNNPP